METYTQPVNLHHNFLNQFFITSGLTVCPEMRACPAYSTEPRIYWAHQRTSELPDASFVAMQVRAHSE